MIIYGEQGKIQKEPIMVCFGILSQKLTEGPKGTIKIISEQPVADPDSNQCPTIVKRISNYTVKPGWLTDHIYLDTHKIIFHILMEGLPNYKIYNA